MYETLGREKRKGTGDQERRGEEETMVGSVGERTWEGKRRR